METQKTRRSAQDYDATLKPSFLTITINGKSYIIIVQAGDSKNLLKLV